jgi:hypothetical protein
MPWNEKTVVILQQNYNVDDNVTFFVKHKHTEQAYINKTMTTVICMHKAVNNT